jgi:hypothetical protein
VQVGEHLDQGVDARVDGVLITQGGQLLGVAHHAAGHEVDHLERRAQHGVVVAHRHRVRDGHGGALERGDHLVLPRHVVGRRRQPVQGRPAQHPPRRVVGHQEGEVGAAAGDQLAAELAVAGHADRAQVTVQCIEVQSVQGRSH